jgi:hypothetical protein
MLAVDRPISASAGLKGFSSRDLNIGILLSMQFISLIAEVWPSSRVAFKTLIGTIKFPPTTK